MRAEARAGDQIETERSRRCVSGPVAFGRDAYPPTRPLRRSAPLPSLRFSRSAAKLFFHIPLPDFSVPNGAEC